MAEDEEAPKPQPPGRLVSHFNNRPKDQTSTAWTQLWDSREDSLWDRGKSSPALIDLIESRAPTLPVAEAGRRLKALVPGCGKGYDVVMLALHGFDVYGLEVSEKGAETARRYAQTELTSPSAYHYGEGGSEWEAVQRGAIEIVVGDFFHRGWESRCGGGEFDLIYDYTFLCALPPSLRKDWARRMGELLAPTGILVCLEFPLYKDLKLPGPPWGLNTVYWNLLVQGGDGVIDEPVEEKYGEKGSFQRLAYIKPARTYEVSKNTDRISIWGKKS